MWDFVEKTTCNDKFLQNESFRALGEISFEISLPRAFQNVLNQASLLANAEFHLGKYIIKYS
jgi:hypothetical protein